MLTHIQGTNEEVTDFIRNLDELVSLSESSSRNPAIRKEAKRKQDKLNQEGEILQNNAAEGLANDEVGSDGEFKKRTKRSKVDNRAEGKTEEERFDGEVKRMEEEEQARHNEMIEQQRQTNEAIQNLSANLNALVNMLSYQFTQGQQNFGFHY